MRWFRTGYNDEQLWRHYHTDFYTNNRRMLDQEDHDPASDSSHFEELWENPQLSQSVYDKLDALGNAGPQEPPSPRN